MSIHVVLGIETSCDETSCALVLNGREVLSNIVASQDAVHAPYGGIVPELASRCHVERIHSIVEEALKKANLSLREIDGIAVTSGPGLMGSLIVGLSYAKALAYALKLPFCGVNHLEAHLQAIFLEKPLPYPFIGLLVSGGHTSLYDVRGVGDFTILGTTRDDAAGEAFDKVAKILGLGYPGGRKIDELSKLGNPSAISFPRPFLEEENFDFSFSGLKTAVLNQVNRLGRLTDQEIYDFCASFQEAVVETLLYRAFKALEKKQYQRIVVAGGVAANYRLRNAFETKGNARGIEIFFPSLSLCTDNAAMVAALGYQYLSLGRRDAWDLGAFASGR
ncbi:MAG: tRNA (adenosine(37)-N6)-threonylcarbamoyltransferase complex transferase subunit TsaD [Deltaproteobacteria bacterium]|nr:tRNA (adenosine(37)-N6)-threonylcarbamoyltransferase complex transferase subunit TsaD [Deltaproteobacteria bacterium]